jgi:hypothetical protein
MHFLFVVVLNPDHPDIQAVPVYFIQNLWLFVFTKFALMENIILLIKVASHEFGLIFQLAENIVVCRYESRWGLAL